LVEDSPSDYELAVRGLRAGGLANPIYHCEDGDDALDFLYQRGRYEPATAPRPGVILLDLNLPGTDGREVLSVVKKDPVLRVIPVIVLTTSAHHRDIQECCRAGANSYMTKPVDLDAYLKALRLLTGYWFEITVLPRTS
jgi:CheY-like chemotaxis protein